VRSLTARTLRLVTAVIMVVCVLALAALALRNAQRKSSRTQAAVPLEPEAPGLAESPTRFSEGYVHIERVGGRIVFELMSERTLGSDSGWIEIQNVVLQLYTADGERAPRLTCERAQYNMRTRETNLIGSVQVEFEDGSFLTTDFGRVRRGGTEFEADSDIYFVGRAIAGSAGRARYDLDTSRLTLDDGLVVRSDTGDSIQAPRMNFDRDDRKAVFPDGLTVRFGFATLQAARGTVDLAEDSDTPEAVAFGGGVRMAVRNRETLQLITGRSESMSATRDAAGRWQVGALTPDGWVSMVVWGGQGGLMNRLEAWNLRAVVDADGLQLARAEGRSCFEGVPLEGDVQRVASNAARAWFTGGAATDLEFRNDVEMRLGDLSALAHRARIDASTGRVMLYGNPAGATRVKLDGPEGVLTADQVVVFRDEERVEARGNVQSVTDRAGVALPSVGDGADTAESVHSACEVLTIEDGGELITFRDAARIWQGTSVLQADEIRSWRLEQRMEARGHVRTTLPARLVDPETDDNADVLLTARALDFDGLLRRAEYLGAVELTAPDYYLESSRLEILFAEDNTVTTVIAEGSVLLQDGVSGYELTGKRAVRDVATGDVHLEGSPAVAKDAAGNLLSGGSLTWNQASGRVTVSEGTETIFQPEEQP
jgi:lipopolysaccharide export system protein LptA